MLVESAGIHPVAATSVGFVVGALDLNELVEEMGRLLEVSVSKKTSLRYDLAGGLPTVDADAAQIRQVVMNLITNASEAIGEEGGTITLRTGVVRADREYLAGTYLNEDLPAGSYVYLEVADTGCGLDEKAKARLFDPFYTTKFTGRGLGLAATLGIVRGHRGAVKVHSEPGKGTDFRVLLPCGKGAPAPPQTGQARPMEETEAWRGSGTILVVDDEPSVRKVAEKMLSKKGFVVLTARDGREAVEAFRRHAGDVVAVLLDMTMPYMSGAETLGELRRIRSDVPVILCSGFDERDAISRFAGTGLAGFLQKPFGLDALVGKVRAALGSRS